MKNESKVWSLVSWLFGIAVLANGVLNLFWGNDFGLGLVFILLSFIYFPPMNQLFKKWLGFTIPYIIKIVMGLIIIWISVSIGALAEGYLSPGSNNELIGTNAAIPFDKTKWSTKDNMDYPYRGAMLSDLIDNVTLKGLNKEELIDLLGQPERIDNDHLFYPISQKRIGLWPLNSKTLVIKLGKDGLVEWRKIHG